MKTVIAMAREAGWKDLRDYDSEMRHDFFMGNTDSLERFAELVRADERERIYFQTSSDFVKAAIADEREACAKLCDEQADSAYWEGADACAYAIRARSNT